MILNGYLSKCACFIQTKGYSRSVFTENISKIVKSKYSILLITFKAYKQQFSALLTQPTLSESAEVPFHYQNRYFRRLCFLKLWRNATEMEVHVDIYGWLKCGASLLSRKWN